MRNSSQEGRGRLLVIEGLDGSGKATQARMLAETLTREGLPVRQISFPNYESESSALVRMYLGGQFGDKPDDVNAYAASRTGPISVPSCPGTSGTAISDGCSTTNTGCWGCPPPTW